MSTEIHPSFMTRHGLILPPERMVQVVWQARRRVVLTTVVFAAFGIVVALLMTPEFRSEARIMPEMNTGSGDVLKRLASVAGFAGVDFSEAEGVDAVRPDLYPNVLQSTPFMLHLIDQPVVTTGGHATTVGRVLLPDDGGWTLNKLFSVTKKEAVTQAPTGKPNEPVCLSIRQQELAEEISERVSAKLDTRSGIITIAATMPDANVAASVAQIAMNYLTQYVTAYRTDKARQDLLFYTQRLTEAQRRFQTAQFSVFQYADQHKNYVVQAATMEKQRRDAELSIAQTVYTELSRQFEQAKLTVQERTPVFKVLEPATVPLKRTAPKRTLVVLLFAALGFILTVLYLFARQSGIAEKLRMMTQKSG